MNRSVEPQSDVLSVGGGHAGAQLAIALRQRKFDGSIAIVGEEPDPPYERPPLSKAYLSGEKEFERILIRPATFWAEREIDLQLGKRGSNRRSGYASDRAKRWNHAGLWQPRLGSRIRRHDVKRVHAVRTRAAVDRMTTELNTLSRVVVIGGGFIGLEAAAVLTKLGKSVVVLEALDRVLVRVAGEPLSRFYEAEHRANGVDVRLNAVVECIEERDGAASGVWLATGGILPGQMIVVGIGVEPAVEPLLEAGAEGGNGVLVDDLCHTSLTDVYAIGDCAAHANRFADGATIRLVSVQNANDHAAIVAKAITGAPEPYDAVPWFWSNQYDLKLQTVGHSIGHHDLVVRGNPSARSFSAVYKRGGWVIALDCVNAVKDYVEGRALMIAGTTADVRSLADPVMAIKELAAITS